MIIVVDGVWKPAKEDVSGWCTLCFGRLDVSRPSDDLRGCNETDELTCSDSDASDGDIRRRVSCRGGTPPLLSIVTHMDQVSVTCFYIFGVCLSSLFVCCRLLDFFGLIRRNILYRVPTNLENLELSGNFINLEKSGNLRYGQGIFLWDVAFLY